jgi:D-alanine-D-alanine ligase-like ATP-grasp enzyme
MSSAAVRGQDRLTVAVLAGGRSSEHEVSLSSGEAVREGLLAAGHDVVWVEIGRDGAWRSTTEGCSCSSQHFRNTRPSSWATSMRPTTSV